MYPSRMLVIAQNDVGRYGAYVARGKTEDAQRDPAATI
jgi:hypothetical protein